MEIKIAYSQEKSIDNLIDELSSQLGNESSKAIVYFASSSFDQQTLAQRMKKKFVNSQTFGCSSAGEIISGKMLKNSVVAMAINDEVLDDFAVDVVKSIDSVEELQNVLSKFERHYGTRVSDMDPEKACFATGLTVMPALKPESWLKQPKRKNRIKK